MSEDSVEAPSLCPTCPKPGACCQGFSMNHMNGDGLGARAGWDDDVVNAYLERNGLPFIVRDRVKTQSGHSYVRIKCTWLTREGKCGHYEYRPNMCRSYEAGSSMLCALGEGFADRDDVGLLGAENHVAALKVVVNDDVWARLRALDEQQRTYAEVPNKQDSAAQTSGTAA